MFRKIMQALPEVLSRLVIGVVFIESGWGKFHGLGKVISYFESLGIPYPQIQGPFVAGVELVTGLLILIGFKTRLASLPLVGIMLVAIMTAKWGEVTDFSSLFGISEFLYIVILLWLVSHGSNVLSADKLANKFCKSETCKKF